MLASQEGLCSMELVSYKNSYNGRFFEVVIILNTHQKASLDEIMCIKLRIV
jgi:hypothetical protein